MQSPIPDAAGVKPSHVKMDRFHPQYRNYYSERLVHENYCGRGVDLYPKECSDDLVKQARVEKDHVADPGQSDESELTITFYRDFISRE